jgi:hypothetical protein
MDEPPHSLHVLRRRPCLQMDKPSHSLHVLRIRPCSQMESPPHSLHVLRWLTCSQMDEPPHSLHRLRIRPCSQMDEPLQVLCCPCLQVMAIVTAAVGLSDMDSDPPSPGRTASALAPTSSCCSSSSSLSGSFLCFLGFFNFSETIWSALRYVESVEASAKGRFSFTFGW